MNNDPEDGLRTLPEAQAFLRCSKPTLYKLRDQGLLEFVKFGKATRITARSLRSCRDSLAANYKERRA